MDLDRSSGLGFGEAAEWFAGQQSCKISSAPVDALIGSMFQPSASTAPCSSVGVSSPFLANRRHHPLMAEAAAAASGAIRYDDVPAVPPTVGASLPRNQRIHCSSVGLVDQVAAVMNFAGASVPDRASDWMASSSEDGRSLLDAPNYQPDVPAGCNMAMGEKSKGKKRSTPATGDFDPSSPSKTAQGADDSGQLRHLLLPECLEATKKEDKKPKSEQSPQDASARKPIPKQTKEEEQNGKDGKQQDYVHVRAKRGQATNSHSLAERVRRERISERMRFLQNLVPGCDKITGKALMLDEIINYVQSLQRQVEFLSMKLATVNPELSLYVDQILSKNNLHLVGEGSTTLGFTLGLGSSDMHPNSFMFQHVMQQPDNTFPNAPVSQGILRNTLCHISPTTHSSLLWEDEVRTDTQMSLMQT